MCAKLWDMSHLFVCFVALDIKGGAMANFWPLHHCSQCMGEKTLSTILHSLWEKGSVNLIFLQKLKLAWYVS